jgi:hypothetical protein
MSNSTHQSSLQIYPVHDLEQSAVTAFRGAHYHLDALKSFLTKPGLQNLWNNDPKLSSDERNRLQEQVNAFHWHMRAFFWELVGAFDAMLLWSNGRFGLGLNERDGRWSTVTSATPTNDPHLWAQKKVILQAAWESDWFFEIREYRNFAHRSFLILQVEYAPSENDKSAPHHLRLIHLLPARVGQAFYQDLTEHLSNYHREMGKVGESIFAK